MQIYPGLCFLRIYTLNYSFLALGSMVFVFCMKSNLSKYFSISSMKLFMVSKCFRALYLDNLHDWYTDGQDCLPLRPVQRHDAEKCLQNWRV